MPMQTGFVRRSFTCFTSVIGLAAFVLSANAQQPQPPSQCPSVSVSCPSTCPKANEDIKFVARLTDNKFDGLTIKWSTSGGKIIAGQGTPTLIVMLDHECETVTASVELYGQPGCPLTASCTTLIDCCWMVPPLKFDEYGDVSCERERTHLASFRQLLENQPGARGYVIFYGGRLYGRRLARRGEAEARAGRIRAYAPLNALESGRVVIVNGGFRETWSAELWIVPAGSTPPLPTPKIDSRTITFRRGTVRKDEYKCR